MVLLIQYVTKEALVFWNRFVKYPTTQLKTYGRMV